MLNSIVMKNRGHDLAQKLLDRETVNKFKLFRYTSMHACTNSINVNYCLCFSFTDLTPDFFTEKSSCQNYHNV